ncbi:hypothetical protein [Nocardia australiensis]|uniref:hypothetical protein n=1 Tax=Nocardia australiensis TaxID=2887191 RepID=UPI001D14BBDB|nr:hypothetical protein [Nocardia australiensis]
MRDRTTGDAPAPPRCAAATPRTLDLRLDDEHVRIHGKGGSVRTVLLDDCG